MGRLSVFDAEFRALSARASELAARYLAGLDSVATFPNATIRGRFALRACIVNHRTTEKDIDAVIEEVLAAAKKV
jgi:hypothetical protein